ncbi:MAG: nucleotidyltransferase domain-containing protein [Deltaproteobacteria bacterium]|nr:nucleotidyltransferase domain-containing protein [Deltaproteobacteria bacterium]
MLLFGSHARGEALAESDLDLVIVSRAFEGVPFLERATRVIEAVGLAVPADLLCYTPQEFARKRRERGIVQAAVEEGIRL